MDGLPINDDEDEREVCELDNDAEDRDAPERAVFARLLGYEATND